MPEMRLSGKRVVLGVTGSIAAYKAVFLLRLLQQEGAEVRVAMTQAASAFVTPLTFTTLAREPAFVDLWAESAEWSKHVQWGNWADLVVIAPCTANTLAKLAHGHCDDAVTAIYLSAACPVLVAPAMDREMIAHPTAHRNLSTLDADGVHLALPESGYLASGLEGAGRLVEPTELLERIVLLFSSPTHDQNGPLAGRKVLITAGPTQEALDPVRYISNHSTGKMGLALAEAALASGAQVTLILGPSALPLPIHPRLRVMRVVSAQEMFDAVSATQAEQHLLIFSAAVADYRPKLQATQKIKKGATKASIKTPTIELVENPDILAGVGQAKKAHQRVVGFALETENALVNARAKLDRKRADAIVLNTVGEGRAFGADTNEVTLLLKSGEVETLPLADKADIAVALMERFARLLPPL
jgi:phosphopantothenoylcysteine decarboxylase/phosphopantothenate--cysteine ligase